MIKFNKVLENIKTYEAGKPIELVVREFGIAPEDVVKLASNENPIGTSPAVAQAIKANAAKAHLYPDDSMFELKAALSEKFDVQDKNIIIGAGSDQVLEFISRAVLDEDSSVLMSAVTFAMYEIYAKQMGAKVLRTASYEHKYDEFMEAFHMRKPKIVYICTPNNPTGDATSKEEVLDMIKAMHKDAKFIDSYTNFITYLFDETLDSTKISDALLQRGVIIRNLASYGMNAVRITIGTQKQNDIFFKHFKEVIA